MRKVDSSLSRERLQEVLDYDPDTGIFKWKVSRGGSMAGNVAGCVGAFGYRLISVDYILYQAHRIAWFYMTGAWPNNLIDHINGNPSDNRFSNLRQATKSENNQNSRSSRGSSVFRGVSWRANRNKWRAVIMVGKKQYYLGHFEDEKEAAEAYQSARRRLHPFAPD
jgi:hypothetical protein